MQTVKDTQKNIQTYGVILLLLVSAIILALLFLNIEKTIAINLNAAEIKVVDDSAVLGSSVANAVKTNQGIAFSCQVTKSYLDQPYCEVIINVQRLNKQGAFTGLSCGTSPGCSIRC